MVTYKEGNQISYLIQGEIFPKKEKKKVENEAFLQYKNGMYSVTRKKLLHLAKMLGSQKKLGIALGYGEKSAKQRIYDVLKGKLGLTRSHVLNCYHLEKNGLPPNNVLKSLKTIRFKPGKPSKGKP